MAEPGKPKPSRPLTPKQEQFIIEYAKDLNATQAALRAGYTGKHVRHTASQLLARTKDILEERKAKVLAKRESTGIASLEETLKLCSALAFHDVRKLFTGMGQCREVHELSRREALMVAGFKIDDLYEQKADGEGKEKVGVTREFKIADRGQYVNMLLKHHGAFPTKKSGPEEPARGGTLPLGNLSLADRLELRDVIATFIQQKSAEKTIDMPKVVNGTNGHGGSNGHGA